MCTYFVLLGKEAQSSMMFRLLILLGLLLQGQVFAQKSWPVEVAMINEATAIPFTRFITSPLHPGIQVGTETKIKQYTHANFFLALHVGYYYHQHFSQGIYLKPSIGYEYRHKSGIAISGRFGLGYLHTFSTQQEFGLVDGEYKKQKDKGNARMMPSLCLALNYYLQPKNQYSPRIFLGYESWVEYPFSPGFIPAMTHITSSFGMLFYPFTRK